MSDAGGHALPLHPEAGHCWPLFALSGGRPVTVAGEWTPRGLWPLTAWDESRKGGTAVSTWRDLVTASLIGTERAAGSRHRHPGLPRPGRRRAGYSISG